MPLPKENRCTAQDYWDLPEGVRAELIDGQLRDLASPNRRHQEILQKLSRSLDEFIDARGGARKVYPAPFAVNLFADDSTFVEPDVSVVCDRSKLSDRGCEGAPDLVVEIVSPSHSGMDYFTKLDLYQRAGVREYWICDPDKERTPRYVFETDSAPMILPFSFPVPSAVLPGFEIDFGAIVANM